MISPEQIRAGRALINAKQSELAKAAGVSLATLNNIERGLGDPRASTLKAIEDALSLAGVLVENDTYSETIILKKYARPTAYDGFTASQRVMEILGNDPLTKTQSVLFFIRENTTSGPGSNLDDHRVCLLVAGKVRKILFDQVGFNLENSARIAEVAGVMLASLVTFPKNVFFVKSKIEDTTISPIDEAITQLSNREKNLLSNPKEFFSIVGNWDDIFATCMKTEGHPLLDLIQYTDHVSPFE
ncbi:helix-turn-helix domain-containing protein [Curvivirga aplysinae]|uniref:helix-turn-helix domain-containing protein n=1 Tax=Curvivirga aplysinae TaxID=2529852 RepID=UPI0012BC4D67|nr:helix-turn-helix transcriptional regulator [Curvivirga aplysinae]MTI10072.1 XRE family transcriptional regulator [Curvivirga aplysinae]